MIDSYLTNPYLTIVGGIFLFFVLILIVEIILEKLFPKNKFSKKIEKFGDWFYWEIVRRSM